MEEKVIFGHLDAFSIKCVLKNLHLMQLTYRAYIEKFVQEFFQEFRITIQTNYQIL